MKHKQQCRRLPERDVPFRLRALANGGRQLIRKRGYCRALFILLAVGFATGSDAQPTVYSASKVKAAFLYHFATYVNWPDSTDSNDEFTIAVLDADNVVAALEQFLPGHTIEGRSMKVHKLHAIADLAGDEVLFIGTDDDEKVEHYLAEVAGRPVLVVTDIEDGLRHGAMINFRIVQSRVRFEISLPAAENAGLEMSSRLLAAAMFVDTAGAIIHMTAPAVAINRLGAAVSAPPDNSLQKKVKSVM